MYIVKKCIYNNTLYTNKMACMSCLLLYGMGNYLWKSVVTWFGEKVYLYFADQRFAEVYAYCGNGGTPNH